MAREDSKKKFFGSYVFRNILAMALVAVALCIVLWIWMTYYTKHGESVDVPEVKGMMINDAEYALEELDLVAVVVDSAYVRKQPAGIVLEQKPEGGSRVKSGREIYLTINQKQTPMNTIPDIAGNCSRREAEARLRALGFKIGPMEFVPGDPDWVIALKVNGREVYTGERVPNDAPVTLVIGNTDYGSGEDEFGDSLDSEIFEPLDGYEEEIF
ncbi:MAG: PASTA domain-containing protein [Bacteroidaceae bacterium]|nr:PASTA domain-containing protein [Bacteroidaceae bacterium]